MLNEKRKKRLLFHLDCCEAPFLGAQLPTAKRRTFDEVTSGDIR